MFKNPATRKRNIIIAIVVVAIIALIVFFVIKNKKKKKENPSLYEELKEKIEKGESAPKEETEEKKFSVVPEEDRKEPVRQPVKPQPRQEQKPQPQAQQPQQNNGQAGGSNIGQAPQPNGQGGHNVVTQKDLAEHPSLKMIRDMEIEGRQ